MTSTPAPWKHTVRPISGVIAGIVTVALAIFLLGDAVVRGSWGLAASFAPWVFLVTWGIVVGLSGSFIRLDAQGITVQNLLRRHRVPWARVKDVRVKYQITLDIDDGSKIVCWGGPAMGRPTPVFGDRETRVPPIHRISGVISSTWQDHENDPAAEGPIVHGWDIPMLAALAVILVAALATLIF